MPAALSSFPGCGVILNPMNTRIVHCLLVFISMLLLGADKPGEFVELFKEEGAPKGWSVRTWDDVKNPGPKEAQWKVVDGILHGSEPRGTWLVSDKEYGDFVLEF